MSDNKVNIFSPLGGVSVNTFINSSQTKYNAFIVISPADSDTDVLLATAPVTGVTIQQLTDFSVTKSLDSDFLVATFGDTPTKITLKGMSFFNLNGCMLGGDDVTKQQILDFYKEYKLSSNVHKRVDISISKGARVAPVCFRCVIVGLDAQNQSTNDGLSNFVYNYTMQLIGVERDYTARK